MRRWGKKMAVIIDEPFWSSLGQMDELKDISNSDIIWFVVNYSKPVSGVYHLSQGRMVCTTLESAVEGLTGGEPVSLADFESSIRRKLGRVSAK